MPCADGGAVEVGRLNPQLKIGPQHDAGELAAGDGVGHRRSKPPRQSLRFTNRIELATLESAVRTHIERPPAVKVSLFDQ